MAPRTAKILDSDQAENDRNWIRKFLKDSPCVEVTVGCLSEPDRNRVRLDAENMGRKRAIRDYQSKYGTIDWDRTSWLITHTTHKIVIMLITDPPPPER